MATIGSIVVNLVAKTSAFRASMARANKTTAGFSNSIARLSAKVVKFGAVAAAAAVTGLSLIVRGQLKAIDSTAKMADVLGLTIEQLQSYNLIAGLSGVSSTEIATAFRRMEKNISDANNGLSTAVRVFDDLGLSLKKLDTLSPDEQFKSIAEGFNTIDNQSVRARVALDLFGRSGLGLIKVLELGADGITKWQGTAKRFGITITREMAAKVEAANDAVLFFKSVLGGLAKRLTVIVAPAITKVAISLTKFLEANKDLIPRLIKVGTITFAMVTAFASGVLVIGALNKAYKIIIGTIKLFTKAQAISMAIIGPKGWAQLAAGLFAAAAAGVAVDQAFKSIEEDASGAVSEVAALTSGMDALTSSTDDFTLASEGMAAALSGTSREFDKNMRQGREIGDTIKRLQDEFTEFGLEGAELAKQQARNAGLVGDAVDLVGRLSQRNEDQKARAEIAGRDADDVGPDVTQFNRQLVSFSAGSSASQKGKKGDPEQTQLLAQIAINTKSPTAVLGP